MIPKCTTFHNMVSSVYPSLSLYIWLLKKYLKKSNFINFFIHPFELSDANFELPENTPLITKFRYNYNRNKVEKRLNQIIELLKENGFIFKTFSQI